MAAKKGFFKKLIAALAVILGCFILGNAIGYGVNYVSTLIGDYMNGKEKAQILEKIPEEFRSNYFFRWFGLGDCEYMTGDVLVTVVFVDDEISRWSEEERQNYKTQANKVFAQIEADAKTYGATLNLKVQYITAKSSGELTLKNYTDWVNGAISSAGLPPFSEMGVELEKKHGVGNAPVIFCSNRDGRCFTKIAATDRKSEYAVLFEDTDALYHEFCHIFGAEDFYYPEEIKELAAKHLPDSLMGSNGEKMDSFTAFLIGWTDSLDENATQFLKATNYITDEYMRQQYADETYTGYVENKLIGDTVYTGNLVDGILVGKGKKERNGNVWEGYFDDGLLDGYGTYTGADGASYSGGFKQGVKDGSGTYKWPDGDTYVGQFKNGKMHGTGTLTWANGDRYVGDFLEGERTGEGTLTWAGGTKYVGEFKDGQLDGYGTITYASGTVRSGRWSKGEFIG